MPFPCLTALSFASGRQQKAHTHHTTCGIMATKSPRRTSQFRMQQEYFPPPAKPPRHCLLSRIQETRGNLVAHNFLSKWSEYTYSLAHTQTQTHSKSASLAPAARGRSKEEEEKGKAQIDKSRRRRHKGLLSEVIFFPWLSFSNHISPGPTFPLMPPVYSHSAHQDNGS